GARRPPGALPRGRRWGMGEPLPVLLVAGEEEEQPKTRSADFLRDSLSPKIDRAPAARVKVVSYKEFNPALLRGEAKGGPAPRVLILCNVPKLTSEQRRAVGQFLREGGGVLVTLGNRVEKKSYNDQLFRDGEGWLPRALDRVA